MFHRSNIRIDVTCVLEVDEVAARLGQFLYLLKTTLILIFHSTRPYAITLQSGTINIMLSKFLI